MRAMLAVLLSLAAGVCIPVQAGINAILARYLGGAAPNPVASALVSFVVGTVALGLVLLVARIPTGIPAALATAPAWAWVGGTLGAFLVTVTIFTAPILGAGTMISLVVASQLFTALVLDHFGWLGFEPTPISLKRVLGALLLVVGVLLIRK